MSRLNYLDQSTPPEHPIHGVTFTVMYDSRSKVFDIHCPEWNCQVYTKDLKQGMDSILSEILEHNAMTTEAL
jgi:hypothetical protein